MRILLINHGTAGDYGGGDGTQIKNTAQQLRAVGHDVSMVNSDEPDVRGFDIAHIFNCRVVESFIKQMNCCLEAGIPTVVSPIWINIPKALWGSREQWGSCRPCRPNHPRPPGQSGTTKTQELVVSLPEGTVNAKGSGSGHFNWMQSVGQLLQRADGLLPNSWLELKAVQNDLGWSGDCFEVAHYGVDPKIFLDADPEPFRQATGIQGPFVVQGGRIEPAKNQAMLCWALRNTNLPVVLSAVVGRVTNSQTIPRRSLTIIEHHRNRCCRPSQRPVHVLPSWMKPAGWSQGSVDRNTRGGDTFGHELEYLGKTCWCIQGPDSVKDAASKPGAQGEVTAKPTSSKQDFERHLAEHRPSNEKLYLRVLCRH